LLDQAVPAQTKQKAFCSYPKSIWNNFSWICKNQCH